MGGASDHHPLASRWRWCSRQALFMLVGLLCVLCYLILPVTHLSSVSAPAGRPSPIRPQPREWQPSPARPQPGDRQPSPVQPQPGERQPSARQPQPGDRQPSPAQPQPGERQPASAQPQPVDRQPSPVPQSVSFQPSERHEPVTDSPVENRTLQILLWEADSSFTFTGVLGFQFSHCRVGACRAVANSSLLSEVDAVVVNDRHHRRPLPADRPAHQRTVAFIRESPRLAMYSTIANLSMVNVTMTYRRDSDVWVPYLRVAAGAEPTPLRPLRARRRPVAWIVSSCSSPSQRHLYVQELQRHIQVDVYGRCGPFNCSRPRYPTAGAAAPNIDCYAETASKYFFYLAFENSQCRDYISEKVARALLHGMVPVVRGPPASQYRRRLPPGSFVHVDDFADPARLAEHLHYLMANRTAYAAYHAWRRHFHVEDRKHERAWCDLCAYLHERRPPRWYADMVKWWYEDADCAEYSRLDIEKLYRNVRRLSQQAAMVNDSGPGALLTA